MTVVDSSSILNIDNECYRYEICTLVDLGIDCAHTSAKF